MDPSTVQGIWKDVLLLIAGALISGVGIFYFQKRIEAKSQRLLARDSTMFARNYQKRVETLEMLYKEYGGFVSSYFQLLLDENNDGLEDDVYSKLVNCRNLRNANSIYLSRNENTVLFDVFAKSLLMMTFRLVFIDGPKDLRKQIVNLINGMIGELELDITPIKESKLNKDFTQDELRRCIEKEGNRIAELYRFASEGRSTR